MAMISGSPRAERKLASSEGSLNRLPEEVIGIILSRLPCARDVVMASLTCQKWHEAAWNYLYRLNFTESDFVSHGNAMTRVSREEIISKVVMKTKFLRVLSISMNRGVCIDAASLVTWLDVTKQSLTSLTLGNRTQPCVNLLDSLGGGQSKLKYLKWESAFIPMIDPIRHIFESLVSLTLSRMAGTLSSANLEQLLCICPNLASLSLIELDICPPSDDASCQMLQLKSSSLKTLHIAGGFNEIDHVVLHMECLAFLSVQGIQFQLLRLVQEKGCSLQKLTIDLARVTAWETGELANSLHALVLTLGDDFVDEWPRYHQMISKVSNLQELRLSGHVHNHEHINVNELAALFPHLSQLAMEYEMASEVFEACSSTKSLNFENLATLELRAGTINKPFALWIGQFMRRCPSLNWLKISGEVFPAKVRYTEPLCLFNTALIEILRSYPQVKEPNS